jgi:hypothetical protein
MIAAAGGKCQLTIEVATTMPTNAADDPTERSMCPAMMTMTMPTARIRT